MPTHSSPLFTCRKSSDVSPTRPETIQWYQVEWNAPHALKGQKLLAQGNTLGTDGRKPVALKGQKLSHLREKVFLKEKSQSLIFG